LHSVTDLAGCKSTMLPTTAAGRLLGARASAETPNIPQPSDWNPQASDSRPRRPRQPPSRASRHDPKRRAQPAGATHLHTEPYRTDPPDDRDEKSVHRRSRSHASHDRTRTTDQEVGGSSPSKRARVCPGQEGCGREVCCGGRPQHTSSGHLRDTSSGHLLPRYGRGWRLAASLAVPGSWRDRAADLAQRDRSVAPRRLFWPRWTTPLRYSAACRSAERRRWA
jgi:hypothetical protein